MKLNKIVGLSLAMVLGLGLVGCGNIETEEQEQTIQQQEEVQDEEYQAVDPQEVERHENDGDKNLNKEARNGEYQFKEREVEQQYSIDTVCMAIDKVVGEKFTEVGIYYELYVQDEQNIVLLVTIPEEELMATDINTWNEFVKVMTDISVLAKEYGYSFVVGVQDENGGGYMVAKDGYLYYDVVNGIDELN